MSKEYQIDITVNDNGAVETFKNVDGAGANLESRLASAKARVSELEAAFKSMGTSIEAPNRMLDQARASVAALESQLGSGQKAANELGRQMETGVAPAVDKASNAMDQMDRIATRLVERMAVLMALKGSEQFIANLFTSAAKTHDLGQEFDLTTDKVQEFKYASDQTGVSLGALTGASDALTKKMAKGDSGLALALDQVGLSFDQIWSMNAGDRFDLIASRVASFTDKVTRSGLEVEIFGTDKIDPIILKLGQLEDAAHRAGVVLGDEDVKALDSVKKSMDTTITQLEVTSSRLLVAAQNWVAYHFAKNAGARAMAAGVETGFDPKTGQVVPMANLPADEQERQRQATIDAQLNGMINSASGPKPAMPPQLGPAGAAAGLASGDPGARRAAIASLQASEQALDTEIRNQISDERLVAEAHRETLRVTMDITKEYDKHRNQLDEIKQKLLTEASLAEFKAREATQAARGYDPQGNPLGQANSPEAVRQRALDELQRQSAQTPGVDTTYRKQQIDDAYMKSLQDATKAAEDNMTAVVGMSTAERAAADSATDLSRSHMGAVRAGDALSSAFGQFTQAVSGMVPTVNLRTGEGTQGTDPRILALMSAGYTQGEAMAMASGSPNVNIGAPHLRSFAVGGPVTQDGPIMAHAGEFVVPKDGALMKGAGGGTTIIIDAKGASFQDDRSLDRLTDKIAARLGTRAAQRGALR